MHCAFGDTPNDALRDRLICGMRSESAQKRLLAESKLTFKKALELAQGMEAAERNAKALEKELVPTQPSRRWRLSFGMENAAKRHHTPEQIMIQEAVALQMLRAVVVANRDILHPPADRSRSMAGDLIFATSPHQRRSQVADSLQPFKTQSQELTVGGGCVLWGFRVIIPKKLQAKVLQELHRYHPGTSSGM